MPALLVAFATWLVSWLVRSVIVKFVVFTALALLLAVLIGVLTSLIDLDAVTNISTLLGGITEGLIFYLVVFRFDIGLPMILAAWLTRFTIRRLPVVG